jgi:hypothetical protein
MCRSLHALKYGTIVSKSAAAHWAKIEFLEWDSLIEKALIGQHEKLNVFLGEALNFIRFTKRKVHQAR